MIDKFQGKYRWLSNFWPVQVVLDGVAYPSVEHAYQAAKTVVLEERIQFETGNTSQAKRAGRNITLRADWDQVKLIVMKQLLWQKFNQEPFKTWLLATGDQVIQEGNYWNDTFWGTYKGKGLNHLGRMIMQIRDELTWEY